MISALQIGVNRWNAMITRRGEAEVPTSCLGLGDVGNLKVGFLDASEKGRSTQNFLNYW